MMSIMQCPPRRLSEGVESKEMGKVTETAEFVPSMVFSAFEMFAEGTYRGEEVLIADHVVHETAGERDLHRYKVVARESAEYLDVDGGVELPREDRVFMITPAQEGGPLSESSQLCVTEPICVKLTAANMLIVTFK